MSQGTTLNRRIVLNARPRGAPTAADVRRESGPVPQPESGQRLLRKRITMQGFIVFDDYEPRWSEFSGAMGEWMQADKVKVREEHRVRPGERTRSQRGFAAAVIQPTV